MVFLVIGLINFICFFLFRKELPAMAKVNLFFGFINLINLIINGGF